MSNSTSIRQCSKCKNEFPATTEYFSPAKRDKYGLDCYCKECRRVYARMMYQKHHANRLANMANYYDKNKETLLPKIASRVARWAKDNPERKNAQQAIEYAGRRGHIPKAVDLKCADCGKQAAEYHHEDYSKPMDVVPLCVSCHRTRHSKYTRGKK